MPTNIQLSQQVEELEQRLAALGDLQTNIQKLEQLIATETTIVQQGQEALAAATNAQEQASTFLGASQESKKIVDELTGTVNVISQKAKKSDETLIKTLGVANAAVLARGFDKQASLLEESSQGWWKSLKIWIGFLVVAILGVVAWEAKTNADYASYGFILKLAVVSPIAYLAYTASKQHRVETNLRHQYNFKATVANSLEAYRQLLADNISEDKDGDKIPASQDALNRFLEQRITAIFREPVENLIIVEEDIGDGLLIGYQGKIYRSLRKMLSRPNKTDPEAT